ncbi:MAG TPA: DUF4159 domain-containing protein, partial [bacterium]|nr:DUF4159 domain-containing protein [bacterium]
DREAEVLQKNKRGIFSLDVKPIGRRQFLGSVAVGLGAFAAVARAEDEPLPDEDQGFPLFARLKFPGGDWYTDTLTGGHAGGAELNLLRRFRKNTTGKAIVSETFVDPMTDEIFKYPFLYMSGHTASDFPQVMVDNLRHHVLCGGMLLADECSGMQNGSFEMACRRLFIRMLPEQALRPLSIDHPVYHCAYDVNEVLGGDKLVSPYDTAVELDGRIGVFYCANDYGCAWEGHRCVPKGDIQREHAFKMGINLLVYALTH